jgi:glycerol-3-phosphate dehydrogenase
MPDLSEMVRKTDEIHNLADTQSVPSLKQNISMPITENVIKMVSKNASSKNEINVVDED